MQFPEKPLRRVCVPLALNQDFDDLPLLINGTPNVFIPVGRPGIHHSGHLVRADKVVVMRLQQLMNSSLPRSAKPIIMNFAA